MTNRLEEIVLVNASRLIGITGEMDLKVLTEAIAGEGGYAVKEVENLPTECNPTYTSDGTGYYFDLGMMRDILNFKRESFIDFMRNAKKYIGVNGSFPAILISKKHKITVIVGPRLVDDDEW